MGFIRIVSSEKMAAVHPCVSYSCNHVRDVKKRRIESARSSDKNSTSGHVKSSAGKGYGSRLGSTVVGRLRNSSGCDSRKRGRFHSIRATSRVNDNSTKTADAPEDDYYSLLGLEPDASQEEIKKAYYSCMKVCHPDLIGNNSESTNFCMFINEVYEILSDPEQRMVYDQINGYALVSRNPFSDVSCSKDRAFVDEFSCIGCKNCANTAPVTFAIEEDYGRARVVSQSGNPELVQTAIETCPVDCIHWVSAPQLALLEDEMRRVERVNVGVMLSGMGYQSPDVFEAASLRWEKKQAQARERARARIMKGNAGNGNLAKGPWWQSMWNQTASTGQTPDEEDRAREKANRTAAAARRWREFSRRGVDRKATHNLPEEKQATEY